MSNRAYYRELEREFLRDNVRVCSASLAPAGPKGEPMNEELRIQVAKCLIDAKTPAASFFYGTRPRDSAALRS